MWAGQQKKVRVATVQKFEPIFEAVPEHIKQIYESIDVLENLHTY